MTHSVALDVGTIARKLNEQVQSLAPELLPNGRRSACKRYWETNGLDDSPRADGNRSLKVNLTGANVGLWTDFGASGRDSHGDMIDLAMHRRFGGSKKDAVAWAKSWLGLDDLDEKRVQRVRFEAEARAVSATREAEQQREEKTRRARSMYLSAGPMGMSPAARYLMGRGIDPTRLPDGKWPGSLRYHEAIWNADTKSKLPCMVATMMTPDGVQVAVHRTWLGRHPVTGDWVKADAAGIGVPKGEAKKVLGKCAGAFIPISKGRSGRSMGQLQQAEAVYVTEGIEDALTVAMLRPDFRVLAAYSLTNLGGIAFPPLVTRLVLVADRDDKPSALDALEQAIARQQARGQAVEIVLPPPGVKDFNEWLQRSAAQDVAA